MPKKTKGFSLIEILIVVGLSAILSSIALLNLNKFKYSNSLQKTGEEIVSALRSARDKSIAQESGHGWGVYFFSSTSTNFYSLFGGPNYNSSTVRFPYSLRKGIFFSNPRSSSTLEVIFNPIRGDLAQNIAISLIDGQKDGLIQDIFINKIGSISTLLTKGIAAYFPFDEASGTAAYDRSGNGNDGTLTNGPTWTSGKVGGALSFDGVDDRVEIPNLINNKSQLTVSAWFKYTNSGTWRWIFGTGPGGVYIGAAVTAGGNTIRYHNPCYTSGNGSHTLSPNTWYHLFYVYNANAGFQKGYINGEQDYTFNCSAVLSTSATNAIGAGFWNNNEYFQGLIDDVRIYNRALSESEIQAIYNATK